MKNQFDYIKAKGKPDFTTLTDHLDHVILATIKAARAFRMNLKTARLGAILHDIGKIHPTFQFRLTPEYKHDLTSMPFRHELSSLLFLSIFDSSLHIPLIEMIVGHHKSVLKDSRRMGIIDLDGWLEGKAFELHSDKWDEWSPVSLKMLRAYGIKTRPISLEEAKSNYYQVLDYCKRYEQGFSEWRGLLMAADHFECPCRFDNC